MIKELSCGMANPIGSPGTPVYLYAIYYDNGTGTEEELDELGINPKKTELRQTLGGNMKKRGTIYIAVEESEWAAALHYRSYWRDFGKKSPIQSERDVWDCQKILVGKKKVFNS